MDKLLDFTGQVALITGAAQGFGALLARALGERGAKLVLGDVKNEALQKVVADLNQDGIEAIGLDCNVAIEAHCKAMVDAAIETFGRLDIAVNNAGIGQPLVLTEEVDDATFDAQWKVNVMGVQYGMRHQIKAMKAKGSGTILNVSSMAGLGGAPRLAAYSAAKHAVIGLSKTAAVETAAVGIRVNAICPFFALTPLVTDSALAAAGLDQAKAQLSRGAPMKRLAEPEEIVNTMVLLLSPGNTYFTGQAIAVDGGVSAM